MIDPFAEGGPFFNLLNLWRCIMNGKRLLLILTIVLTLSPVVAFGGYRHSAGAVYVMTNDPGGNQVMVYNRDFRGRLTQAGAIATGGSGSGGGIDPLASQGSLIISPNKRWLFAVNAGSDTISVFRVRRDYPELIGTYKSGGSFPTSLTLHYNLLYVLNAGAGAGGPNITGFRLRRNGLEPLADSKRSLTGSGFHQVGFTPHGDALLVTKGGGDAEQILVFGVDEDGKADENPTINDSNGIVPFGFIFDRRGHLLVAEAGSQAVSTYELLDDNTLSVISPSVSNDNAATCWIVRTWFGAVFTANTGADNISTYKVRAGDGSIDYTFIDTDAGDGPIDMATTFDGRFLYVINANDGTVGAFRIGPRGRLWDLGSTGGLPVNYAQGIAAR
jgi:6-phosphogluconolactonase